jgi:hydroxymethylbilane synthase
MVGKRIEELPKNARVGTGSLRRQAQVLAIRSDLQVLAIRGNVDTRLRKLRDGEFDAVILALAGLKRAGLFEPAMMWPLETNLFVPAAGQGALALECRRDDAGTAGILRTIHDPLTAMCVDVERAVVEKLQGDCHSPIAALAEICGAEVVLRAAVARRDGKPPVVGAVEQRPTRAFIELADAVVGKLEAQGAREMLKG